MTTHPPGLDPDTLTTPGEAARQLGIHPATLSRWVTTGNLTPAFDRGGVRLYLRADIDQLAHDLQHPDWAALQAVADGDSA